MEEDNSYFYLHDSIDNNCVFIFYMQADCCRPIIELFRDILKQLCISKLCQCAIKQRYCPNIM